MMNDLIQLDETIALLRRDHHCPNSLVVDGQPRDQGPEIVEMEVSL